MTAILQMLKCFAVGLGAMLLLTAVAVSGVAVIMRIERHDMEIALWFAARPRLLKIIQISGVFFLGISVAFFVFTLGCSILEAM